MLLGLPVGHRAGLRWDPAREGVDDANEGGGEDPGVSAALAPGGNSTVRRKSPLTTDPILLICLKVDSGENSFKLSFKYPSLADNHINFFVIFDIHFSLKTVDAYYIDVRPRPEPVLVNDVSDLDNLTLSESKLVRQLGFQTLLSLE